MLGHRRCTGGGTADTNPDDYKRVVTLVRWTIGKGSHFVLQSTTLALPGPVGRPARDRPPSPRGRADHDNRQRPRAASTATNRKAAERRAGSLDGTPTGTAAATGTAGTAWTITWPLGTVGVRDRRHDAERQRGARRHLPCSAPRPSTTTARPARRKAATSRSTAARPTSPPTRPSPRIGGSRRRGGLEPQPRARHRGLPALPRAGRRAPPTRVCSHEPRAGVHRREPPSSGTWDYYVVAVRPRHRATHAAPARTSTKITHQPQQHAARRAPVGALAGLARARRRHSLSWAARRRATPTPATQGATASTATARR